MPTSEKRSEAGKRIKPTKETWTLILERSNYTCEWNEAGEICGLKEGQVDPIGGGIVKLTPDHKSPHSVNPNSDATDIDQWQALCGRHQVIKKNYWDNITGKMNIYAIIQSASEKEKMIIFKFLLDYFGYIIESNGDIIKHNKRDANKRS